MLQKNQVSLSRDTNLYSSSSSYLVDFWEISVVVDLRLLLVADPLVHGNHCAPTSAFQIWNSVLETRSVLENERRIILFGGTTVTTHFFI